eukprot:7499305-Prorocentrum_lima.AAC.1
MLEAFCNAGARFRLTSMAYGDMEESTTLTRRIHAQRTFICWKVLRKSSAATKSTTHAEYGELQEEYLKALDFMDMLTDNLRFYNACRATTGQTTTGHDNCGFALPAQMLKRT